MSVFGFIRRALDLVDPRPWQESGYIGSDADEHMTTDKAFRLVAFLACIRIKSNTCGTFPLQVFRREKEGYDSEVRDHPLYSILHDQPNADFTAARFWTSTVAALDLWGNAFLEKVRGTQDQIVVLNWLFPQLMTAELRNQEWIYRYRDPVTRQTRVINSDDLIHIRGMNTGDHFGMSVVEYGAQALRMGRSAQATAGGLFRNGLFPSGWLDTKGRVLDPTQREDVRNNILNPMTGSRNAGRWGILEGGFEWKSVSINPVDAQLLESMRFSVEDICRLVGVPPVLVGHASRGQTMWGTGVEAIFGGWLTLELRPVMTHIEEQLEAALLTPAERVQGINFKFNFDAILRADAKTRAEVAASEVQNGLRTRDEIRIKQNLPPMPGGEFLTVQSQMVRLDKIGEAPAVAPADPAAPSVPVEPPANTSRRAA